jgi:gluconolactonase
MTTRISSLVCLATLLTIPTFTLADDKAANKPEAKKKAVKTVEVEIKGGLKLNVPENWKQTKPSSRLRLAQFAIPKVKGDTEDGELALFNFGPGGGAKANIDRWVGQFHATERAVKVKEGALETGRYFFVEISGTYDKPIGPPIARQKKASPGSRMLGVILGIEDKGIYFLKMTGPDKTVAAQAAALRKSFGGDAKKEKEVALDEVR